MLTLLSSLALVQLVSAAATQISFPTATGNVTLTAPQIVKDGEVFDGNFRRYGRNAVCLGNGKDVEGGDDDAVFIVQGSGTLKNVIIGADAIEGVHCTGSCTIESVFWENVCEDALSLVGTANRTVTVKNCAARDAIDKVIQHNSPGTVSVDGFTVDGFGKLYRSCGNCKTQYTRKAIFNNIYARNGGVLAGVNSNYGDVVILSNLDMYTTSASKLCEIWTGNNNGSEPTKLSAGPDGKTCILSNSSAIVTPTPITSPSPSASKSVGATPSPSKVSSSPSPSKGASSPSPSKGASSPSPTKGVSSPSPSKASATPSASKNSSPSPTISPGTISNESPSASSDINPSASPASSSIVVQPDPDLEPSPSTSGDGLQTSDKVQSSSMRVSDTIQWLTMFGVSALALSFGSSMLC